MYTPHVAVALRRDVELGAQRSLTRVRARCFNHLPALGVLYAPRYLGLPVQWNDLCSTIVPSWNSSSDVPLTSIRPDHYLMESLCSRACNCHIERQALHQPSASLSMYYHLLCHLASADPVMS